ncbi:hypothetical protein Bca4012_092802 [Brassica carinata]|uniref:Uncharacterized protein n=2 Tax=Brassica oleracea TaxID=3712 RepID=A0A0D2ZVR1_BRAOL|nr:unnamed protein product [Brassica oleracea]
MASSSFSHLSLITLISPWPYLIAILSILPCSIITHHLSPSLLPTLSPLSSSP